MKRLFISSIPHAFRERERERTATQEKQVGGEICGSDATDSFSFHRRTLPRAFSSLSSPLLSLLLLLAPRLPPPLLLSSQCLSR